MHEQLNTLFAQGLKCSLNAAVGMQQVPANYAIIARALLVIMIRYLVAVVFQRLQITLLP